MSNTTHENFFDSDTDLNHKDCIVCTNWKMYNHLEKIYSSSNTLYVLRHGQSEANEKNLIVSDARHGMVDYGLSSQGIQEIRDSMRKVAVEIDNSEFIIYSSPFLRAIQTASLVSEVLDVQDIYCDARLRERFFGEWELKDDTNYQKVWDVDYLQPCHKRWGVESTYEVLERVTSAVREIDSLYMNKNIFFVTHGDVAQILICAYLNRNPQMHRRISLIETGELRVFHESVEKTESNIYLSNI